MPKLPILYVKRHILFAFCTITHIIHQQRSVLPPKTHTHTHLRIATINGVMQTHHQEQPREQQEPYTQPAEQNTSCLHLHVRDLKGHLEGSPFYDWFQLYGRFWIGSQSQETLSSIYSGFECTREFSDDIRKLPLFCGGAAGCGAPQSFSNPSSTPEGGSKHIEKWIVQMNKRCHERGLIYPLRMAPKGPYTEHTPFRITQDQKHVMLASPRLVLDCGTVSGSKTCMHTTPPLLLSRSSAEVLFGDCMRGVEGKAAVFSKWVAVEWSGSASVPTSAKARRITMTSCTSKYTATKLQVAYEITKTWASANEEDAGDPKQASNATKSVVCGISLHPSDPFRTAKFYTASAPIWTLDMATPATGTRCGSTGTSMKRVLPWSTALEWYVRLKRDGHVWDPVRNRDHIEMCPPVSERAGNHTKTFRHLVAWLRRERADMCMLHKFGAIQREKAWRKGARTYHDVWRMQRVLKPILKLPEATWASLWANTEDNPERRLLTPRRITNSTFRTFVKSVTTRQKFFAVDFETIRSDWIFMVAVACVDPVAGTCEVFVEQMNQLSAQEQVGMLKRWVERMHAFAPLFCTAGTGTGSGTVTTTSKVPSKQQRDQPPPPILHWSSAEPVFLTTLFRKKPELLTMLQESSPIACRMLEAPPYPSAFANRSIPSPKKMSSSTCASSAVQIGRKRRHGTCAPSAPLMPPVTEPVVKPSPSPPRTREMPPPAEETNTETGLHWVDLCTVFQKEPIAIPGCFDFQLKHVVRALVAIGKLPSTHLWAQGGVQDGLAAMHRAEAVYEAGSACSGLEEVRKYNKADVLVLVDIVHHVLQPMV